MNIPNAKPTLEKEQNGTYTCTCCGANFKPLPQSFHRFSPGPPRVVVAPLPRPTCGWCFQLGTHNSIGACERALGRMSRWMR